MRINELTFSISKALPLGLVGLKVLGLSIGATALSLGINLTHLDTNAAQASFETVGAGTVTDNANSTSYSVVGTSEGIVYASEIFGSGSNSTVLPGEDSASTPNYQAVSYTHEGGNLAGDGGLLAVFTLTNNAVFEDDPLLLVDTTGDGAYDEAFDTPITGGGGDGDNFAKIKFANGIKSDGIITLVYRISNATALANPGSKIEMDFQLNDVLESYTRGIVSEGNITIAESEQAVTASLQSYITTDSIGYRVSVESEYTEFTGTESADEAQIGILTIEEGEDILCPDGEADFVLGSNCATVGSKTGSGTSLTKTALTITNGQFAASMAGNGAVVVGANTVVATDENTATVLLGDSELTTIIAADEVGISIVADGDTAINIPEDPPVASLTIDYSDATFATTVIEGVELLRIKADGTQCTVYNVPASSAADTTSIRITNTSSVPGTVNATLYALNGTELFASQPLNNGDPIKSDQTYVVTPAMLETLNGKSGWTGRAVLVLSSTLSSIEVLALLRESNIDAAPLTNLSVGATGKGCTR